MDFPPPYVMCFETECRERQEQRQVSEWEATLPTYRLPPTRRILDPRLAVAKYRRSAAGDGDGQQQRRPPRSIEQLEVTWNHLKQIFVRQSIHDDNSNTSSRRPRRSLSSLRNACAFVDDRIRAMQVDFVRSQQASASIQLELARYQILSCYLLSSDLPRRDYEPKFAHQALWTALQAYWNDGNVNNINNNRTVDMDDEVLCLSALLHLATCIIRNEEDSSCRGVVNSGWQDGAFGVTGSSYGTILILARHCSNHHDSAVDVDVVKKDYPKFQYALQLVRASILGMYRNVLTMLLLSQPNRNKENETDDAVDDDDDRFGILCRLCMAPALQVLRLGALRQYNMAFGKREKITGKEMARLLYLPNDESALDFARAVGLPVVEDDEKNCSIIMKAAPIVVSDATAKTTLTWSRSQDDDFVFFGSKYKSSLLATTIKNNNDDSESDSFPSLSRIDEDGIRIPPACLLERLIAT